MNHDETNFTNPHPDPSIDPELEARLIAWVMGEVSAVEAAELERLVEEKPEVRLFRDRFRAVSELAVEAAEEEEHPLRLAPERRRKLLAALDQPIEETEAEPATVYERSRPVSWRKWIPAGAISVAASFVLIFGVIRLGLRHSDLLEDQAGTTHFSVPPPPPAGPDGGANPSRGQSAPPTLRQLDAVLDTDSGVSETRTEKPFGSFSAPAAEEESVPLEQLDVKWEGGSGETAANAVTDLFSDPSEPPMAAGVASSVPGKNASAEKKGPFYNAREAGRLDVNRSAADPVMPRSNQAAAKPAADSASGLSKRQRSKETPADETVFTLSPFEISKDDDAAYRASETLAGTRLEAELRDTTESQDIFGGFADSERVAGAVVGKSSLAGNGFTREVSAADESVSTFSLHVGDVSFRTAQAALQRGEWPEAATIRPEEFYNAFDYGDPAPTQSEMIACRIDQAAHPVLQQRNLVRIALQVSSTGRGVGQPLNLTVMVDTSGSMEREDRRESVRNALNVLATQLGPNDQVTVIGFARQPRLLEEALPGDQADQLAVIVANTPSEGGTNLEAALDLSVELAQRHYDPAAQNRIVLMTDGAANLGNADPVEFTKRIEEARQQGIAFDACGVGMDGMNDAILEALTRKGDGRYYVLDRPEDADEAFADLLAGAFRPAAENIKVQVRFNPARVGRYRLIGFEKHRLNEEDFRDDQVDAAELAAEEAAVALYQVEVLPEGEGELGEVYVRFRDTATGGMVERSWTAPYDPHAPAFDLASAEVQLAGTSALLAEVLEGGPGAGTIPLDDLVPVVNGLRGHYAGEKRVQELVGMFETLRRIQNTGTE